MSRLAPPPGATQDMTALAEKANRAVQVANQMLPQWRSFAQIISRRPNLKVRLHSGPPMTDGDTIRLHVPIELADVGEHVKGLCGDRDEHYQQMCPSCRVREEVNSDQYHELFHIVYESFVPVAEEERQLVWQRAVDEQCAGNVDTRRAKNLRKLFDDMPEGTSYWTMAARISPFLPFLLNCLEDVRIEARGTTDRPGTLKMFLGTRYTLMTKQPWGEAERNMQAAIALYCEGVGFDSRPILIEDVGNMLDDPRMQQLMHQLRSATSALDVYRLGFPVLEVLRDHGFCLSPEDFPDDPEPEPEPEQNDDQDAEDSGGEPDDSDDGSSGSDDPGEDGSEADTSPPEDGDESSDDSNSSSGEEGGADEEPEGGKSDADADAGDDTSDDGDGADGGSEDSAGNGDSSDDAGSADGDDPDDQAAGDDGDPSDGDAGAGDDSDASDQEGSSDSDGPSDGSEGEAGADEGEPAEGGDGEGLPDPSGMGTGRDGDGSDDAGTPDSPSEGSSSGDGQGSPQPGVDRPDGRGVPDPSVAGQNQPQDWPESDVSTDGGPSAPTMPPAPQAGQEPAIRPQEPQAPDPAGSGVEPTNAGPSSGAVAEGSSPDPGEQSGARPEPGPTPYTQADLERDGTPESLEEQYKEFSGHSDPPDPDGEPIEVQALRQLIELVLQQGSMFDAMSLNIGKVSVIRPGERRGGWEEVSKPKPLIQIPENILQPALGRLRAAFTDNQRAATTRNLRGGRVDSRVLGKRASVGDDRLFKRKNLPGKKDYAVLLGADMSGSTSSGVRARVIKETVMAQAELLDRLGIPFAVAFHTGIYEDDFNVAIMLAKDFKEPWDLKAKQAVADVHPSSGNVDGHTLEYYRKLIQGQQATDKLIIYYTDGAMPAANYDEELAILQREIVICKRVGIHLVGVGVNTDSPKEHGLDTIVIGSLSDVVRMVEELKQRLIG